MNISDTLNTFPEYAKDVKLNYSKILNENILDEGKLYGIILVSGLATKLSTMKTAALEEVKGHIDDAYIEDVYGAYSVMSMNAIYYRFTHLATGYNYGSMPANLRMQYLTKHTVGKSDFEMMCLAVAVIEGCGKCINAHEVVLRENDISNLNIQTTARIASIINSIANVMRIIA